MRGFIRKHAQTLVVAAVSVALTATAPAIAATVVDFARNAGKVDNKDAVGASASIEDRKGALVATSPTTGRLPNNIITRAPDAQLLDGKDSSEFLLADGTAANADAVGGIAASDLQTKLARTVVLSADGTPVENGTALRAAVASVNMFGPTGASPWLVLLGPGNYDIGTDPLALVSYMQLAGSGRDVTKITCACASGITEGTIHGVANSTVRDVTIHNSGGTGQYSIAYVATGGPATVSRARVEADQATSDSMGVFTTGSGRLDVVDTEVKANGTAGFGVYAWGNGSQVWLVQSSTSGSLVGIAGNGAMSSFRAIDSQITGGIDGVDKKCVGSYTGSFALLDINCAT